MITIFTPVYNRAYIISALYQSLCKQTSMAFEWLVIDDGSTDNIKTVIQQFIDEAKIDIRFFSQPNGGKHRAINRGVSLARGSLFFIVDSDDYLEPEALETCYIKCERQALDFVFFDADILNKEKHKNISLNYQRKDCTNPELVYLKTPNRS